MARTEQGKCKDKERRTVSTRDLLDQQEGLWEDLGEGRPINDGIFPLTVLNDVVGEVQQVESV